MPFFSIVLPTYNRAHMLPKAIESVLSQTFEDFELIIVDDASTDNTVSCIKSYSDSRIVYLRNEKNLERCRSRNVGIERASGTYICFIDSDDYHLPFHLEELYNEIQNLSKPQVLFFTNAFDEKLNVRSKRVCPPIENYNVFHYIVTYTFNPQRMCVHADICKHIQFDPDVYVCEDVDFAARIACAYPIVQIPARTTVYVNHPDSFTGGDSLKPFKELENYRRIFSKKELRSRIPLFSKWRLYSMCYFHIAQYYQKNKNFLKMYTAIFRSFFLCPRGYNRKTNKILCALACKGLFKTM
ncbi:MAG: glycosyltransferase family 2 protein [Bacteroidales bacterium]|jgi:glycosyltransferase involved in cell wall biosynthesis|nr:glycosyltransferase family 2 protein [Bacteroidales bacterium]